jgi:hypothetical protein
VNDGSADDQVDGYDPQGRRDDAVWDPFNWTPPARDKYILAQGFWRKPSDCKKVLPDERMWAPELHAAADYVKDQVRIDRDMLFTIATRVKSALTDPWAAIHLHAAIVFWGARPGRSTTRAVRPLAQHDASARLSEAISLVVHEEPTIAYEALSRRQRLWVSGLGPSYFTKLIYFAGYQTNSDVAQPLIMDDNVVAGLIKVTRASWKVSLAEYLRFLELAKETAKHRGVEPDVIERGFFDLGS